MADTQTSTVPSKSRQSPRILVLGAGSVGLYAAQRIIKRLGRRDATVYIVDPRPYMTYAPFLPEVSAGSIDGRNAVAPIRRAVPKAHLLQGMVTSITHADRKVVIKPEVGDTYEVSYDHLVIGLGSVARTLPIPGLADFGVGFKTIEEGIALRNRVLNRIDTAASVWDPELRKRLLTFTFVGGGFAGIEAMGEVESMARDAVKYYKNDGLTRDDLRFVMVEGSGRILPEVSEEMGEYTLEVLRKRAMEIHLNTFLNSCVDGHVVLSDGTEFETDTLVWTAGVKANPVLQDSDLPLDKMGRVITLPTLQVATEDGEIVPDVWAAGDCAAVPDLTIPGATCPPNAQHAIRQAKVLGTNVARSLKSDAPKEYSHKNVGAVASLGLYSGVAQMFGRIKVKGWLAWFLHRSYHVMAMPTFNRKVRIMAGWTWALVFRREVVSLGSVENPREAFRAVAVPAPEATDKK